jgi:hypothetical protein
MLNTTMKIVCAGCHRSGSTWLYNAVRLIMESKNEVYACFVTEYDPENKSQVHVIKTHNWHKSLEENADKIFTTKRDLRDIAASAIRRGLIEEEDAISYLRKVIKKEYMPWKSHSDLEIVYEDLIINKNLQIQNIAKVLKVTVKPNDIHQKIENLPIPEVFDPLTQLHPNHITDGRLNSYKATLTKDMQDKIYRTFNNWMFRNGYLGMDI